MERGGAGGTTWEVKEEPGAGGGAVALAAPPGDEDEEGPAEEESKSCEPVETAAERARAAAEEKKKWERERANQEAEALAAIASADSAAAVVAALVGCGWSAKVQVAGLERLDGRIRSVRSGRDSVATLALDAGAAAAAAGAMTQHPVDPAVQTPGCSVRLPRPPLLLALAAKACRPRERSTARTCECLDGRRDGAEPGVGWRAGAVAAGYGRRARRAGRRAQGRRAPHDRGRARGARGRTSPLTRLLFC